MPFQEPGTQELLERVLGKADRLTLTDADRGRRRRAPHRAHARHARASGTSRSTCREIRTRARRAAAGAARGPRDRAALDRRARARPSGWPATSSSGAASRSGEDLFVAHVPERIAENHFLEEIATLPHIVGGVGRALDRARSRELFEVFGSRIVQTTPVQAELAKIWTNILRYTNFALPNLLMMNCEQYGANVFEVIDLINRDYPRGGIAMPGLTGGTCLRKDFTFSEERSSAPGMLLAVSRVHESVPLFLVEGLKRAARRRCATARSRCSG